MITTWIKCCSVIPGLSMLYWMFILNPTKENLTQLMMGYIPFNGNVTLVSLLNEIDHWFD